MYTQFSSEENNIFIVWVNVYYFTIRRKVNSIFSRTSIIVYNFAGEVLVTLQQKKDVAFQDHIQVGVVNLEQKQLKLDVSSGVYRVNQIQMLFKDLLTNPATSKAHKKGKLITHH